MAAAKRLIKTDDNIDERAVEDGCQLGNTQGFGLPSEKRVKRIKRDPQGCRQLKECFMNTKSGD